MITLIFEILQGNNRSLDHHAQTISRAKQLGYIMETPSGYLTVTPEGMEFFYATV